MSQIENAVSIPTEALIPEMEGEKVFIYKSGKASTVKVQTGLRTESRIQITDGLNFGDTLADYRNSSAQAESSGCPGYSYK